MKRITDLKTRRGGVQSVSQDASVEDAVRKFLDADVSSLVVYDDEKLVGIFTKNDLARCCVQHPDGIRKVKVAQYIKRNPYTATTEQNLDDVIEMMVAKGFRHVPILEHGRAVGMVTPIDILEHQKGLLRGEHEELVRYIRGSY
ncbi:MAG: CBS domain-containing protein [Deltaproteobacteria bacterium]|nr:CBS domain-containing protein [Deltaproteobacteria bacterium]